jgi:hypothetical protein
MMKPFFKYQSAETNLLIGMTLCTYFFLLLLPIFYLIKSNFATQNKKGGYIQISFRELSSKNMNEAHKIKASTNQSTEKFDQAESINNLPKQNTEKLENSAKPKSFFGSDASSLTNNLEQKIYNTQSNLNSRRAFERQRSEQATMITSATANQDLQRLLMELGENEQFQCKVKEKKVSCSPENLKSAQLEYLLLNTIDFNCNLLFVSRRMGIDFSRC